MALTDTIENDQCFYRVRCEAAKCLTKVANAMEATNWTGPPAMLAIFRKMFGSHSCPAIVRQNNFNNLQHYFLQKTIPVAMAGLRNMQGICVPDIMRFLLDLFKYNDNSKNKFSDNYYRASLVDALGETVTQVISMVCQTGQTFTADSLSANTKLILEEVTRYINLEKLLPCYKFTITISCLRTIRKLQKYGHLPSSPNLFRSYANYGHFLDVRCAAIDALVDFTKVDGTKEDLEFLLDMVENDPIPYFRHYILQAMVSTPPFTPKEPSPLNTEELVDRLWNLLNCETSHDARLRCDLVDLYHVLYGRNRPKCIGEIGAANQTEPSSIGIKTPESATADGNNKAEIVDDSNLLDEPMETILTSEGTEAVDVKTEMLTEDEPHVRGMKQQSKASTIGVPSPELTKENVDQEIERGVPIEDSVFVVERSSLSKGQPKESGSSQVILGNNDSNTVLSVPTRSSSICSESSQSLPGVSSVPGTLQPTGFDSSMFEQQQQLKSVAPSTTTRALSNSPPSTLSSSATGLDLSVGGGGSSSKHSVKPHKAKRKKEKKKKHKHKHKHKHDRHDRQQQQQAHEKASFYGDQDNNTSSTAFSNRDLDSRVFSSGGSSPSSPGFSMASQDTL